MHTNWLVTRVSLESDGFLEMDIQTHNYTPYDVNSILDIVASLGNVSSWTPTQETFYSSLHSPAVQGTVRVYLKTRLLARAWKFCQRADTIQALSEVSAWLNRELDRRR